MLLIIYAKTCAKGLDTLTKKLSYSTALKPAVLDERVVLAVKAIVEQTMEEIIERAIQSCFDRLEGKIVAIIQNTIQKELAAQDLRRRVAVYEQYESDLEDCLEDEL
ncbi:hypothetical protein MFLAVUS_010815 [Mucor flavus]|uniref:Uncharacterized protein n=1 Tax=Mucor flavus TaxID=439312 RepID=A0ABP9ZDV0_9FUNG